MLADENNEEYNDLMEAKYFKIYRKMKIMKNIMILCAMLVSKAQSAIAHNLQFERESHPSCQSVDFGTSFMIFVQEHEELQSLGRRFIQYVNFLDKKKLEFSELFAKCKVQDARCEQYMQLIDNLGETIKSFRICLEDSITAGAIHFAALGNLSQYVEQWPGVQEATSRQRAYIEGDHLKDLQWTSLRDVLQNLSNWFIRMRKVRQCQIETITNFRPIDMPKTLHGRAFTTAFTQVCDYLSYAQESENLIEKFQIQLAPFSLTKDFFADVDAKIVDLKKQTFCHHTVVPKKGWCRRVYRLFMVFCCIPNVQESCCYG